MSAMTTRRRQSRESNTASQTQLQRTRRGSRSVASDGLEKDVYDISSVDWSNVEAKFHELMSLMNASTSNINAIQARAAHIARVSDIIASLLDRAQEESRQLLISGDAAMAAETGIMVLRLRKLFYKADHLQLVPAYLHLARTRQFQERYGDAEEMLSLAQFIVMKNQDVVSVAIKAELHQSFGLLYAADNKLDAAAKHLSYAIYYLSHLHGARSIYTSFSYFDLANVFASKSSMESAMALYDSIKEIWYNFLVTVLSDIVEKRAAMRTRRYEDDDAEASEAALHASARAVGSDNLADASKMLYAIMHIQREHYRVNHPSTARAAFVLGMFLLWVDNMDEAREHMLSARSASQHFFGERHPVVQEIESWCANFDMAWDDSGAKCTTTNSPKCRDVGCDKNSEAASGEANVTN